MATEDPIGLVDAPAGVAAVNPFEEEQEAHSPDEAPIVPESPLDIRIIALVHRPNPLTTSSSPSTPCPQPSPLPSADVPHKLHHRSHSEIPATKAESEDHDLLLFNEFINSCKNTNSTGSSDNEAEIKANEKLNPKGGERYHHHFGDETSKAVLEALEPHHSLKELLISKYNGVTSPTWMVNWRLSSLQSLTLDSCDSWEILPTLGQLQKLKVLHIKHMGSIKLIDDQLYGKHGCGDRKVIFPSLEELILECMHECEEWLDAEEGFLLLPCLRKLHLISCTRLKSIPLSIFEKLIVELVIRGCNVLGTALPQCGRNLKYLRLLEISMYNYESCLDLRSLEALEQLRLNDCRKITLVDGLDSLTHLTSLKLLQIRNCPAVLQDEKNLHAAGHAARRDGLFTHLDVDMKFLRGHGFLPNGQFPNLMALKISGVGDNDYKAVMRKPWFHSLKVLHLHALQSICLDTLPSSLEELALSHCPFIDSLPVNGRLPASLKKLHIFSCPKLKERCQKDVGADWVRIARIPCIRIDDEMVQMLYEGKEIAANFS